MPKPKTGIGGRGLTRRFGGQVHPGAHFYVDEKGKIQFAEPEQGTPVPPGIPTPPAAGGLTTEERAGIVGEQQRRWERPSALDELAEFFRPSKTAIAGTPGLPRPGKVGGRGTARSAIQELAGARLAGLEELPEKEPAKMPEFGKSLQERIAGVRSKEDEVNMMLGMAEALSGIGQQTSASQILLGLPEKPPPGLPEPLLEESRQLGQRRRALEMREELPEWDPKSEISKLARETLGESLGAQIDENISAGQIKEQFGDIGGLFMRQVQLKAAQRKETLIPNDVVKELGRARSSLVKLKDLDKAYKDVEHKMGPILSRWNTMVQKFGWDDPQVSDFQADLRDAFAKYLYGTSGKQLSNREIAFMTATSAQSWQRKETFKELLSSMRERQLVEYNTMLEQQAANGKNIEPHLLPGWSYTPGRGVEWGQKVRIPRHDTAAIQEAERRGIPYEAY